MRKADMDGAAINYKLQARDTVAAQVLILLRRFAQRLSLSGNKNRVPAYFYIVKSWLREYIIADKRP